MHMPHQRVRKPDKLSQGAQTRQAIPGFNEETPWIKRALQNPSRQRGGREKEGEQREKLSQEITGNIGSKDSNKGTLNTHAAGS